MAKLSCTLHLQNLGPTEAEEHGGATVLDVINAASAKYPRLKNYVLDDQERVRKHIAIFIGGTLVGRNKALTHPVAANDKIFIMQALSGG